MTPVSAVAIGQVVTVRCPALPNESEDTWLRGVVRRTLARNERTGHAVHVVEVEQFKWAAVDAWGEYDGVPEILAREVPRTAVLEWVDTWPRRYRS